MSIDSLSSISQQFATGTLPSIQGANPSQQDSDGDSDSDSGRVHSSHGRGGAMGQAMMQTFSQLGLAMPTQGTTPAQGATPSSGTADTEGDQDDGQQSTGNVKADFRKFMHSMFEAMRNDAQASATGAQNAAGSDTGSAATGSATPAGNDFSSRLGALISQVSSGSNVPSDLQASFDAVVKDLQPSATAGGTQASAPTLKDFLTTLAQNMASSSTAAAGTGNLVSIQA